MNYLYLQIPKPTMIGESSKLVWYISLINKKSGNQYFALKPFDINCYKYIKLTIKETFGGNKTYLNKVFLFETLPENKKFWKNLVGKTGNENRKKNLIPYIDNVMSETSYDHNYFYKFQQQIHYNNSNIKSVSPNDEIYNNPEKESQNTFLENCISTKTKSVTGNCQLKRSPNIPENEEYNVLNSNLQEMESKLLQMKFDHDLKANTLHHDQSYTLGLNYPFTERNILITTNCKSNKITDKKNTFSSVTSSSIYFHYFKVILIKFNH